MNSKIKLKSKYENSSQQEDNPTNKRTDLNRGYCDQFKYVSEI